MCTVIILNGGLSVLPAVGHRTSHVCSNSAELKKDLSALAKLLEIPGKFLEFFKLLSMPF